MLCTSVDLYKLTMIITLNLCTRVLQRIQFTQLSICVTQFSWQIPHVINHPNIIYDKTLKSMWMCYTCSLCGKGHTPLFSQPPSGDKQPMSLSHLCMYMYMYYVRAKCGIWNCIWQELHLARGTHLAGVTFAKNAWQMAFDNGRNRFVRTTLRQVGIPYSPVVRYQSNITSELSTSSFLSCFCCYVAGRRRNHYVEFPSCTVF